MSEEIQNKRVYQDAILKKVQTFAALKYPPEDICRILELQGQDALWFMIDISDPEHQLCRYYNRGKLYGNANIEAALMKKAQEGDTFSEESLRDRITQREVEEYRLKLFGL